MSPSQIADLKKIADIVSERIISTNEGGMWMEDGKASAICESDMYLLAGMNIIISAIEGDWSAANLYMVHRTILSPIQCHLYGTVLDGGKDRRLVSYEELGEIKSLTARTKFDNVSQTNKGENHAREGEGGDGQGQGDIGS